MKLLNSQKTELFDLINNVGLNPLDFEVVYEHPHVIPGNPFLVYKNVNDKEFFFAFFLEAPGHMKRFDEDVLNIYAPAFNVYQTRVLGHGWEGQVSNFVDWLNALKIELSFTDPWELGRYCPSDAMLDGEAFSKFNNEQILLIESAVARIKGGISDFVVVDPDRLSEINKKLDYLVESAKKVDRIDWKNIFVGTIFQVAVSMALPVDKIKDFFMFAVTNLGFMRLTWMKM